MPAKPTSSTDHVGLTLRLLDELLGGRDGAPQVGVRLWDGTLWPDVASRPATVVLKHPGALRAMFLPGTELALAEAYLYDDFDVEGGIEAVFDLADALAAATAGWSKKLRAARDLLRLPAASAGAALPTSAGAGLPTVPPPAGAALPTVPPPAGAALPTSAGAGLPTVPPPAGAALPTSAGAALPTVPPPAGAALPTSAGAGLPTVPPSTRGPVRLTGQRHSVERDRQAVTYHYDVSNDFYALWLDRRMVYSCAYFQSPTDDLNTAQERKLDYICRKLRLRPGQRVLDIGCGWGGLVICAAERHGVDATGITLSRPQAALANERIRAVGLADRARVLVQDYRETEPPPGGYDALVSVGMFEHVGAKLLPTYFAQAERLLRPGGVFLNHGIANRATDIYGVLSRKPQHGPSFNDTYVFPDGELVPINVTLHAAEESGFEVRDVESLREHYALTLRHWVRRLEAQHVQALRHVDEPTYRVWRLFMSGSAHGFTHGRLNVYQALLVKPDAAGESGLPLTRAEWYS
jgi:cyclopropane-fatty-acyl-phospholipid synthase